MKLEARTAKAMPKLRKKISASGREMRQRWSMAGVKRRSAKASGPHKARPTKLGVARARDVPSRASRASVRRSDRTARSAPYESESKLSHSKFGVICGEKALRATHGPRLRKP